MLFAQFEFGRNTQTALFFRNKSPKVTFLFQVISIPGILLQKAVSPQTNPVKSYWQLAEVDTRGMFLESIFEKAFS